MSEISTLIENFKKQSNEQVTSIEQELQNATMQLNSFMTAKLSESETIIKQGMASLDLSNEQLLEMLAKHQTDMSTALQTYLNNVQAHTTEHLDQFAEDIERTIEAYTQHIAQLIEQREDRIAQVIKSEMKAWAVWGGLVAMAILVMGLLLGALIVSKFSKPTEINQLGNPVFNQQQPINYGQQR